MRTHGLRPHRMCGGRRQDHPQACLPDALAGAARRRPRRVAHAGADPRRDLEASGGEPSRPTLAAPACAPGSRGAILCGILEIDSQSELDVLSVAPRVPPDHTFVHAPLPTLRSHGLASQTRPSRELRRASAGDSARRLPPHRLDSLAIRCAGIRQAKSKRRRLRTFICAFSLGRCPRSDVCAMLFVFFACAL